MFVGLNCTFSFYDFSGVCACSITGDPVFCLESILASYDKLSEDAPHKKQLAKGKLKLNEAQFYSKNKLVTRKARLCFDFVPDFESLYNSFLLSLKSLSLPDDIYQFYLSISNPNKNNSTEVSKNATKN